MQDVFLETRVFLLKFQLLQCKSFFLVIFYFCSGSLESLGVLSSPPLHPHGQYQSNSLVSFFWGPVHCLKLLIFLKCLWMFPFVPASSFREWNTNNCSDYIGSSLCGPSSVHRVQSQTAAVLQLHHVSVSLLKWGGWEDLSLKARHAVRCAGYIFTTESFQI